MGWLEKNYREPRIGRAEYPVGCRLCQALIRVIDLGGQPFQMLLCSQLAG